LDRKFKQASSETMPEKTGIRSTAREYLESIIVTVILALFGTTFLMQAFKIPSGSMEDTLLIGDHLMVDKVSFAPHGDWSWLLPYRPVQRGQIIIFRHPRDPGTYLVKRVIGLPGDRIHLQDKRVFRNGQPLDEPQAVHRASDVDDFRDNFPNFRFGTGYPDWMQELPRYVDSGEIVVPEGQYFAMGDNRDLSSDSRYWGFVPRENIVGRPLLLYWSVESSSDDYQDRGATDSLIGTLSMLLHFPQKTRWSRMFHGIH
jgi:signal peptidase I